MLGYTHRLIALPVLAALAGAGANASSAETPSPAVIELFTSQGCSSCPPADKLLADLAKRPDIIALSFPVTYWDYLGWKDTFAKPEYSTRQRDYSVSRGDGEVYTPQAVVNGSAGCVGSRLGDIEAALKATRPAMLKAGVAIKAHKDNQRLIIEAGAQSSQSAFKSGKIYVASIIPSRDVSIGRGENAGERVTYTNVVRKLTEAGKWEGSAAAYSIPLKSIAAESGDGLVVFLQTDGLGPIVAAARVEG